MSKVAIITDTHFGAREGRAVFHDFFAKFWEEQFFPYLRESNIDTILHLGDLFDRRKYIDYYSLKRSKEYFFNHIRDNNLTMHVLVGNHDAGLKNTLMINSPELLLKEYGDSIKPISKPTNIDVGCEILMVPWICADNYQESMDTLKSTRAQVCMGHFEIAGFAMYRGMESHEGFDKKIFDKFDLVCSGHYHHRSSNGNIHYLGNTYEITHMDANDPRGFHVFDTSTRELTFVKNNYTLFERYVYDDERNKNIEELDISRFKDKFVKVVVQKKTDYFKFDTFLDRLYNCGAHEVKIIDDNNDMSAEELDESIDIEDTASILSHYIENADVSVDRKKLSSYMKTLYNEALNAEV